MSGGERNTTKVLFGLVFFVFVLSNLYYFVTVIAHPFRAAATDLNNFLTGAILIRDHQAEWLYDLGAQSTVQKNLIAPFYYTVTDILPFRSLPFVGLLFVPLTYLPFPVISIVWTFVLLALWFGYVFAAMEAFPRLRNYRWFFLFPLGFYPIMYSVRWNQISVFLALTWLMVYLMFKRNQLFLAGITLPILLIKPQYFLMAFVLLLVTASRPKLFLLGNLITSSVLLLINLSIAPIPVFGQYFSFLLSTEKDIFGSCFAGNAGLPAPVASIVFVITFVKIFKTRRETSLAQTFFLVSMLTIPLAVHSLTSDVSLLALPIFILLQSVQPRSRMAGIFLYIGSVYLTVVDQTFFIGYLITLLVLGLMYFPRQVHLQIDD